MKYFMYDIYHIVNFQTVTRKRKVIENDNSNSEQSNTKKKQVKPSNHREVNLKTIYETFK